ncbi:dihydroxyacetone kinase subunit L [Lichenicola cladoniae]|uniref:Dihydroxyacetone kinase subunit L n=1 Tax=Lichenicola cladoniae TaxID=1484109 RepID=A0A6M8GZ14_9PROT|nr:dihydroxyacetone kinase subunit DhaL [Lichenicola cladoniae]NPD68602.1 dihydroxyacetone kinase subunit L [Acetobacteraceae bacterium]QKE88924.1 dihydroxyacetone kinase subunit L [Lichenicola cladoniae]
MAGTISLGDAAPVTIEIARAVIEARDHLSEIDGATGDGDHGVNMAKGFRLVVERLDGKDFDIREGFATIGDTLLSDIGGSMGPLYGSFFTEMADALDGKTEIDPATLAAMLKAGEAAIVDLGEAKVGDKTLIDVLTPSRIAVEQAAGSGKDLSATLAALRDAAATGLESTRDLVAKRGRAARLGERSRGVLDAGAASCELILRTLANGLSERLS